jgi:hypothetical protein
VSLLRTNTLRVGLAPDQIDLAYIKRWVTLHGVRTTVKSERLAAAPAGEEAPPWLGAVQALGTALPAYAGRPAHASVILSSRLVRYVLVPWSDALSDAEEEAAYARHCLDQTYGEAAAQWELRVSDERDGAPKLACAVDAALPAGLREAFAAAGVRLDSIQPNLMAVYNDYRRSLQGRYAWLALLEQGSLCLALLNRGRWERIRSMRIGPGWRTELSLILEREAYLSDPETAPRDVFLWASGLDDVTLPESERWQFHLLAQKRRGGSVTADAGRFLTAAEG